ncbi:MAG: hypothetical protein FWG85_06290 [Bacteroidetes bacterium]|nr:hypothetical protein [Bacteroidota bacterium]
MRGNNTLFSAIFTAFDGYSFSVCCTFLQNKSKNIFANTILILLTKNRTARCLGSVFANYTVRLHL